MLRRRLTIVDDASYEVVSLWLPVELAEAVGLGSGRDGRHGLVSAAMAKRYQHVIDSIRLDVAQRIGELLWEIGDAHMVQVLGRVRGCVLRRDAWSLWPATNSFRWPSK